MWGSGREVWGCGRVVWARVVGLWAEVWAVAGGGDIAPCDKEPESVPDSGLESEGDGE